MSGTKVNILALTVIAVGAHVAHRFVGHDGATAGAGENTLGVAAQNQADGEASTIEVIGTSTVDSDGAIGAGGKVEVGVDGKAKAHAAGVVVGVMAPGSIATASDQPVEVLLIQNA